jgi:hypothetical protein
LKGLAVAINPVVGLGDYQPGPFPANFQYPGEGGFMCRNIKTLANFEPPATDDEVRASALQFVRKLSGTTRPSKANEEIFNRAVEDVTDVARRLVDSLVIHAPPRDREVEARKAKERSLRRFG